MLSHVCCALLLSFRFPFCIAVSHHIDLPQAVGTQEHLDVISAWALALIGFIHDVTAQLPWNCCDHIALFAGTRVRWLLSVGETAIQVIAVESKNDLHTINSSRTF